MNYSAIQFWSVLTLLSWINCVNGAFWNDTDTLFNYTFKQNCSALNTFVAVINPVSLRDTLLSEQALFAPYTYHLAATELILLEEDDNNACFELDRYTTHPYYPSNIELSTDVADKVVLIWRGNDYSDGTYNCSDESKVYILGNNGAAGVLIANNQDATIVETIEIDYDFEKTYNLEPSIPARMITQNDGWYLENYIESQSGVTITGGTGSTGGSGTGTDTDTDTMDSINNDTLLIEMSCLDSDYPSIICIVDGNGRVYWMDGDYQQEASEISWYNDHPVYKKEGYLGLTSDLYMYLELSSKSGLNFSDSSDDYWHWVVSFTLGASNYSDVVAYCNSSSLNPGKCPYWYTWKNYNNRDYFWNKQIFINDTLCEIEELYVCIESDRYQIAGVGGTYKLITKDEPIWFREPTEQDMTPAFLVFSRTKPNNYFYLVDGIDFSQVAFCYFQAETITREQRYSPDLCDGWIVVKDLTTDDDVVAFDPTFSVTNESCIDNSTLTSGNDTHEVCVSGISLNHEFLEGEYVKLNETTSSGKSIWYSAHLEETSNDFDAYIYYIGDFDDDLLLWVIGSNSPVSTNPDNLSLYAYCAAFVDHPADCQGCWFFYYDSDPTIWEPDWDPDCGAQVARGPCAEESVSTTTISPADLASHFCVTFTSQTLTNFFGGKYVISSELYSNSSKHRLNGKYYWTQVYNGTGEYTLDGTPFYIMYDSTFDFWLVTYDTDGMNSAILKCDDYSGSDPSKCDSWENIYNNQQTSISFEAECNFTIPKTTTPNEYTTTAETVIIATAGGSSSSSSDETTTTKGGGNSGGETQNEGSNDATDVALEAVFIVLIILCCLSIAGVLLFRYAFKKRYPGKAGFGAPMPNDQDVEIHRRASQQVLMGNDILASTGTNNGEELQMSTNARHGTLDAQAAQVAALGTLDEQGGDKETATGDAADDANDAGGDDVNPFDVDVDGDDDNDDGVIQGLETGGKDDDKETAGAPMPSGWTNFDE